MCLGIPGQIVSVIDADNAMAMVEIGGVRRPVNVSFVDGAEVGDWVLVHVGFAMSRIDADEAARTLEVLEELGEFQEQMAALQAQP